MPKENYNPSYGKLLIVILIAFTDLLLTIYLKYESNNISIYNFRFDYLGNILNISITSLLLIAVALFIWAKNLNYTRNVWIILFLTVLYFLPLILLIYFNKIEYSFTQAPVLGYPFEKVLIAGLNISHSLGKIFTVFIILGMILGSGKIFFFRSIIYLLLSILLLFTISFMYSYRDQASDKLIAENLNHEVGVVLGAKFGIKTNLLLFLKGEFIKLRIFIFKERLKNFNLLEVMLRVS